VRHGCDVKPPGRTRSLTIRMRILRGLRSQVLPCGCLAGVYETYDRRIVTLLDEKSPGCADPTHENPSGSLHLISSAELAPPSSSERS
jgi:hypothetical protein